jgi:hypothetical protein
MLLDQSLALPAGTYQVAVPGEADYMFHTGSTGSHSEPGERHSVRRAGPPLLQRMDTSKTYKNLQYMGQYDIEYRISTACLSIR